MCMKVCLCMGVCVSLGDGGSVGSQGKRAAAMACGRPRWSSAVVPIGDGMVKLKNNRYDITKGSPIRYG